MVTGDRGVNGPLVLRAAEVVTQKGPELVLIQPHRMVAVPAKGPTSRRQNVTVSGAQVMIE